MTVFQSFKSIRKAHIAVWLTLFLLGKATLEFEIAKAKLLYKECGSEPGDKCFKSKYLPLLEELPKPKNK